MKTISDYLKELKGKDITEYTEFDIKALAILTLEAQLTKDPDFINKKIRGSVQTANKGGEL